MLFLNLRIANVLGRACHVQAPTIKVMCKDFYNNVFTASAIFLAIYGLFMV